MGEDFVLTPDMLDRGACALINAEAREPYDRADGRWRPAVIAEAVILAALKAQSPGPRAGSRLAPDPHR